jgi:hypothetical protein
MTYLTTGKRSIIEAGHAALVQRWAREAHAPAPVVQVRAMRRRNGTYRPATRKITIKPTAPRDTLVHEFAHHLDWVRNEHAGHSGTFRIALVEAAVLAFGSARLYAWKREHLTTRRWARRNGLLADDAGLS